MAMNRSIVTSFLAGACGLAVLGFFACGGSNGPTTTPTPPATTTTTTLPPVSELHCSPTPPPLFRIRVKIHDNGDGHRRILDSRPEVLNVDHYCERANDVGGHFCFVRSEGDPMAADCDKMAIGRASDTGRWGPTWHYESKLCVPGEDPGCSNHPDNQFLLAARGAGTFQACAAPNIPLSQDPDYPGTRCGTCVIKDNTTKASGCE